MGSLLLPGDALFKEPFAWVPRIAHLPEAAVGAVSVRRPVALPGRHHLEVGPDGGADLQGPGVVAPHRWAHPQPQPGVVRDVCRDKDGAPQACIRFCVVAHFANSFYMSSVQAGQTFAF